jgi:hypothetical protein
MLGNDISVDSPISQACVFEGLLAFPPDKVKQLRYLLNKSTDNWESAIKLWKPNDLVVKSLSDGVNRLGVGTDVITFLDELAVEPIYQWLVRKGVSTPVMYYSSVESYAEDLRFNRAVKTVYVSDQEHARIIGMRATVVPPNKAWSL